MTVSAVNAVPKTQVERPLVAIVMDTTVSFDREIVAGAAQYAREAGDWQLYMEEERGHRLPNRAAWKGHGILASFDDHDTVEAIVATGLPVIAVGGMGCHDPQSGIPRVATDHARIATLAADHFLDRGLQSFAFYGPAHTDTLAVRDAVIADLIHTIRARACDGLSVEDLATYSGLARWKLEEQFNDAVGHSVHDDIVRVRLAEAQRLLRTTDLPLKVIAPRAGFHSVPSMITVFRRRFGITPARFRRLERGRTVATVEGSECDDDGDEAGGLPTIPANPK
jgi:AraC-like DNA-binding protein